MTHIEAINILEDIKFGKTSLEKEDNKLYNYCHEQNTCKSCAFMYLKNGYCRCNWRELRTNNDSFIPPKPNDTYGIGFKTLQIKLI